MMLVRLCTITGLDWTPSKIESSVLWQHSGVYLHSDSNLMYNSLQ